MNNNTELENSIELMHSFWNIQKNLMRFVQKTAADNDLSVPQYTILMMLIHQDVISQKAVQEKTFLPKSTLSQAIDGLVQSGLLDRQQVEGNRREMQLSICQKGKDLIDKIHLQKDGLHQLFHHAVESLTDRQFQDLLHSHNQIASYFEERGRDYTC